MAKYSAKLNCIFDASAGTLDFTNVDGFDIRNLFSIVNLTTGNTALYLIGIAGYGAAIDASGKVITLAQSTTGMNDSDTLIFVYDEGDDVLSDFVSVAIDGVDSDLSTLGSKGIYIKSTPIVELLTKIYAEQRITNVLMSALVGTNDNLDAMATEIINSNASQQ
jgi:hypothetical protein